jgi:hypothetical protein
MMNYLVEKVEEKKIEKVEKLKEILKDVKVEEEDKREI